MNSDYDFDSDLDTTDYDDFCYDLEYDEGGYEDYEPNPYDGTYSED